MMRVIVLGVQFISAFHAFLGLVSVCVGVVSSIQAEVWLAHSVSPIWSGGFVSMPQFYLASITVHIQSARLASHFKTSRWTVANALALRFRVAYSSITLLLNGYRHVSLLVDKYVQYVRQF